MQQQQQQRRHLCVFFPHRSCLHSHPATHFVIETSARVGTVLRVESREKSFICYCDTAVLSECRSGLPSAPKLLITPIFPDFYRFFPVFPWTSGRVLWIPGVQTEKMGERWGKMGKEWVKNEIAGLQKTALMHAFGGLGRRTTPARRRSRRAGC